MFVIVLSKAVNFIINPSFCKVPIILLVGELIVDDVNAFIIVKVFLSDSLFTMIIPPGKVFVFTRNMRFLLRTLIIWKPSSVSSIMYLPEQKGLLNIEN